MSDEVMKGYMKNSLGYLVPIDKVPELDKIRDELVRDLIEDAKRISEEVKKFKLETMEKIESFLELAAQEYQVKLGGKKGNIQLSTYDGEYRVRRDLDESISFNEGMSMARQLIFECIDSWTENADPALVTLVQHAFETNKEGHLSVGRILSLRSYKIDDPKWVKAMELITDSIMVQTSGYYLRFYKRQSDGKFVAIPINPMRL